MSQFASILQRDTHTVSVTIKIEGRDVTANPGGLLSLSIAKELNKIPTANIFFSDGIINEGKFPKSSSDVFLPGKKIEIQLGHQQDVEPIFKGIIVRQKIQARRGKPSALEIECKDMAIKTTLTKKSRYFYDLKDNELITQILKDYKNIKTGSSEASSFKHKELVQYNATDWDFLLLRAEANGFLVHSKDGTMNWVKPKINPLTTFAGIGGTNIVEFEADIDSRNHYEKVEANTWDHTTQKVVKENNTPSFALKKDNFEKAVYDDSKITLYHGGDMDTKEVLAWANAQKQRASMSQVRGRVRIDGIDINPTDTIGIQRIGDRFDGNHYVFGVMHSVHAGTWETDIQFGLPEKSFGESHKLNNASGLFPAIQGLHVGKVSKIEGDEREGNHRIQVRIPYLAQNEKGKEAQGVWARLASLYAGDKRGFVFRPEIDDEVVLGFINDDPNDAVILGSLHSNKAASPYPSSDKNIQKAFKAKEGMEMIFNDKNKSIELKTKEGYSILIDESAGKLELKDKNKNIISFSASGISIESKGKLDIKASGIVSIDGTVINLG